MYVLQPQPMLAILISKSIHIVIPPSIEVLRSISSSLEDNPFCVISHVAIYLEWFDTLTLGVYSVHTRVCADIVVDVLTVSGVIVSRTCSM